MADIMILVKSVDFSPVPGSIRYSGQALTGNLTETNGPINWIVDMAVAELPATVNTAIHNAAVLAAQTAGFRVNIAERRGLIGGIVGV